MQINLETLNNKFENVEEKYLFQPKNLANFGNDDVNNLLMHCSDVGVSDIHIEGGKHIVGDIHSRFFPISTRILNEKEVERVIKKLYDEIAIAQIYEREAIDTNYTIKSRENNKRYRYRVNAVGSFVGDLKTVQITIRTLDSSPPKISLVNKGDRLDEVEKGTIGLEKEIWDCVAPDQGLVIVTGPTGSGKSTLLAGIIRKLLEKKGLNKKIVTCEAPIEYVFDKVQSFSGVISQTEIYTQLKNFYEGVRAAMRRKPDIIFIGEARDIETIDSAIMAAQTGHLLYTTMHTNSVSETLKRSINVFPENERQAKLMDLIDTTQLIIAQRLLPTLDGKRCAVKEYLHFDNEIRGILRESNPLTVTHVIDGLVREKKQRLIDDVYLRYKEGLISEEDFKFYQISWGKHSLDETEMFDFIADTDIHFMDSRVFAEKGLVDNIHFGVVIDKNDDNHGKVAFVDSREMDLDEFKEEANTRYYFSVDSEKINSKKLLRKIKMMIHGTNQNKQ